MANKAEASSSTRNSPMLYLYGYANDGYVWYRIDVESLRLESCIDTNKPKTECFNCYAMTIRPEPEPMQLSPFAQMTNVRAGSWTIIGEDIYCVGTIEKSNQPFEYDSDESVSENLLKLNTKNPKSGWKIISSSKNFPTRYGQFVSSIVLELDIESFGYSHSSKCVVVEKEGEPTRILVLSYGNGELMFYNVITGESLIEDHPSWELIDNDGRACNPKGLEDCEDIGMLDHAQGKVRAMVNNSTLYWFNIYDMYLYGYDLVQKRWFQSKCLKRELWTISPMSPFCDNSSLLIPCLFDLRNVKLLLIVPRGAGKSSAAILAVVKDRDSLNVSVESLHTLLFEHYFRPDDGMVR
ncbi:hypothetical protein A4A49_54429 [Nicotiana attenuata]|uniref:Uncharacterized protein n=1 Tax=Nicotiana attenuata TaxID=49451 RepID=A0A1J6I0Q6_NICAT|nr:hypothetical protein A4A49_54429 [Nicotiana attenuata]